MIQRRAKTISREWQKILALLPGYDSVATAGACWFDAVAAQFAIDFFHERLTHIEGTLSGKPFILEMWQRAIIGAIFGWKRPDGSRRYREAMIYCPRKQGKALDVETPIPTPGGWRRMGDIAAGDYVFDHDGRATLVVGAFDPMNGRKCYRVKFDDGTSIVADAEHLWETRPRSTGRPRSCGLRGVPLPREIIYTTEQIRASLKAHPFNSRVEWNHRIPVAGALKTDEVELLIEPYALGAWLGDGDSDCARITCSMADVELIGHINSAGGATATLQRKDPRSNAARFALRHIETGLCARGHDQAIHASKSNNKCLACERETDHARRRGNAVPERSSVTINERLRSLGVLGNKHIPPGYLRASLDQRTALMQGLMDTDGYVSARGQCEFATTAPQLRDGFMELARSLGYKPNMAAGRATIYGRDCGEKYRIRFHAYADSPCFRLNRKRERLQPRPTTPTRSMCRQIVAVDEVESRPVRCIAVANPRKLYLAGRGMVPTHNTPLAAGIANCVLFIDEEMGQQNICVAGEREQAALLFRHVKGMIENHPTLSKRAKIYKAIGMRSIETAKGFFRVMSADADTKHGGNLHLAIVDELHVQPNRDLVDVIQTSMASANRRHPLLIHITTADYQRPGSICNEKHDYASKVRDGIIEDPSFLPVIYEAKKGDDWTSPKVWAKANPNLGVSVSLEYLERECKRAQDTPGYENTFRRLHLNQITEQSERWLSMERWDECGAEPLPDLTGRKCFAGLDLATTTDIAALVLDFPMDDGSHCALAFFWVPRDNARKREMKDRVPYTVWIREGLIAATEGDVIDYDVIRRDIGELGKIYNIAELAIDRWSATQITTQLQGDGVTVVPFGQGFASMSGPSKELEKLVLSKKLRHGGNAVLRWMVSNVAIDTDAAGNIKPSKKRSPEKIDGVVSLVMGLGRAIVQDPDSGKSVYDTRGIDFA